MAEAELLWVIDAQQSMSQESDFKSRRRQFNLFKDEKGVWRCEERLSNAEVPYAVKNPILLPRAHPLTTREAHERFPQRGQGDPDQDQKEVLDT